MPFVSDSSIRHSGHRVKHRRIAMVPEEWIFGEEMLCPSDPKQEKLAVKAYADPDESWTVFQCKIRKIYGKSRP